MRADRCPTGPDTPQTPGPQTLSDGPACPAGDPPPRCVGASRGWVREESRSGHCVQTEAVEARGALIKLTRVSRRGDGMPVSGRGRILIQSESTLGGVMITDCDLITVAMTRAGVGLADHNL
ncbi:unnamed protein product [Lota lota]